METIKSYFKEKNYGFYVTLVTLLFTIITLSIYASRYGNYESYMSWPGFYLMIIGAVLALITIVIKKYDWAPIILAAFNFIALMLYITKIYNYVTVVLVGIDIVSFSASFIHCTALFATTIVLSTVAVFLKQLKDTKEPAEESIQEGEVK